MLPNVPGGMARTMTTRYWVVSQGRWCRWPVIACRKQFHQESLPQRRQANWRPPGRFLGSIGLRLSNANPRDTPMTDDKIALSTLLEKSSDASFLREMIGFAAERLMELETETLCNAAWRSVHLTASTSATVSRNRGWRHRPGRSSCASPNCAAELSQPSGSRAGWPRRR